ncbi:MAG: hypothetical protein ACXV2C_08910 [Candidatus Bathyarchaeia archaeon]
MSNDENTDLLLGLGLSLNQARVYLGVLKLEKTTMAQVVCRLVKKEIIINPENSMPLRSQISFVIYILL